MAVRSRPPSGGSSTVLKSASTGVLRPMNVRTPEDDPVQAVLNRSWKRPPTKGDEDLKDGDRIVKRSGIRRALQDGMDLKDGEGPLRSRLGATGGLFIDTGGLQQRATLPAYIGAYGNGSEAGSEVSSPAGTARTGDGSQQQSPLLSDAGLTRMVRRRATTGPEQLPKRRYSFEITPLAEATPRLRSPPRNGGRGSSKLVFKDMEKPPQEAGGLDDMARTFLDMVAKLQNIISQTSLRMNDMLVVIRKRHVEDPGFCEQMHNMHLLSEVVFMVGTANYHLGKWHHQLEPKKVPMPSKPSKGDVPVGDLLAQVGASISRMEERAGKLCPVLQKIVTDARAFEQRRRGPSGEPISPSSKNPAMLAMKRGFQDVEDMPQIIGHLEHLLDVTQQLAHPVGQGQAKIKSVGASMDVLLAAKKFAKLRGQAGGAAAVDEAVKMSFTSLASSVNAEVAPVAPDSGATPVVDCEETP